MSKAVCLGETMAMLTTTSGAPLHEASELMLGIGGAESNVAMGLAALGMNTEWIGRVGQDGFGARILRELAAHGVGTEGVEIDPERPTGLYVKIPATQSPVRTPATVLYYRAGSAASAMGPAMLDDPAVAAVLAAADLIHLSGITPALSASCAELCRRILTQPRSGRMVSFDVNWRPALWAGQDASTLAELADLADVVLLGSDEAELAFGTADEGALRKLLPSPEVLVVKNADVSATAIDPAGRRTEVPALAVDVVEPVGAGDSFAAGYLSGLAAGLDQKACLRRGHLSAAATLSVPGDRGPLPSAPVMAALLDSSDGEWTQVRMAAGQLTFPPSGSPGP